MGGSQTGRLSALRLVGRAWGDHRRSDQREEVSDA